MGSPVTKPAGGDVPTFIGTINDVPRRGDCRESMRIMRRATGAQPEKWATGTIGFGRYHYRYALGREREWLEVGFAPRPGKLTIHLMSGFVGCDDLLSKLGEHARGKSCLYGRRLSDIDRDVLGHLVDRCVAPLDRTVADLGAVPRMSAMPPPSTRRARQARWKRT